MTILDRVKNWFEPPQPVTGGFYEYHTPPDAAQQFRLHLRVEPDGHGVLLINAARMLHLNQTATELASFILQQKTADEAARELSKRYKVDQEMARADFEELQETIWSIAQAGEEICPVTHLDVARIEPPLPGPAKGGITRLPKGSSSGIKIQPVPWPAYSLRPVSRSR